MSTVSPLGTQATTNIAEEPAAAQAKDFLLFCPSASDDSEVMNAIHALYYLPSEYKLVVMKNSSIVDGRKMAEGNEHLMDRILFETDTRAPGETPSFSYANAVICNDVDSAHSKVDAPHIVISDAINDVIEGRDSNSYTVPADNPEALASAAMRIASARTAAV
jgi:hypothetical protein